MAGGTAHLLLLYAATELVACAVPGPAVLAVTSHALAGSARAAIGAVVGINLGNVVWYLLTGFGLTALVAAAPGLFAVLRWAGIAYLLWLGISQWRGAHAVAFQKNRNRSGFVRGLLTAVAVQLSNPKALLFFSVVLPPFIDMRAPIIPQLAALMAIGTAIEAISLLLYAGLAWRLGRLALSERSARWIGRTSGALLMVAAVGIAFSGQT